MVVEHMNNAHRNSSLARALALILLFAFSLPAYCQETISASVDRSRIYEGDTLTLRLTAQMEMELSFGGLMSFGRNQVEAPTLEGLENDFEILDRQQSYNMRSVNGDAQTEVTWNYTLMPKRTGELTIPAAEFKSANSQALVVKVLAGRAPRDAASPPSVFMEVELDKDSVYVQEQVIYTVRLYALGRLASGNIDEPTSNDAIIEPFGQEKKYYRMAYEQRYEVIERNYLVFPQKSGTLQIEPLTFNGVMIDSQQRRRMRVNEASEPSSLRVMPPPSEFTGNDWLPAKSLEVSETWQEDSKQIQVGDAITRTITISALGLLGSALPPTPHPNSTTIKSYPDKAIVESLPHDSGAQATRKESITLIAVNEGELTIPKITIPWWDTINKVQRTATLPARSITILPSVASLQAKQSSLSIPETTGTPSLNTETLTEFQNAELTTSTRQESVSTSNQGLIAIIVLLSLGWISSTWYLLQRLKRTQSELKTLIRPSFPPSETHELKLSNLLKAINSQSPDMPKLVIAWLQHKLIDPTSKNSKLAISSIAELKHIDTELYRQLSAYESTTYSQHSENDYDEKVLINCLKNINKDETESKKGNKLDLRPFYP